MTIMANEVKTRGVSYFEKLFEKVSEIVISVRGKNKYVVLPYEEYEEYRVYKLDKAYRETMKDLSESQYHAEPAKHLDAIEKALSDV